MIQRRQVDIGEELAGQIADRNPAIGSERAQMLAGGNQPKHPRRSNPARAAGSVVQHDAPAKFPRPESAVRQLSRRAKIRIEPAHPRFQQVEQSRLVQAHEEVDHVHGQCPDAYAAPT